MSPRIEVIIDELVLHGFEARQRDEIAAALRTGLAAALQGWAPAAGGSADHLEAGSFALPDAAPPALVGQRTARQIRQALDAKGARSNTRQGGS
jgi:hypothetical protein